MTDADEVDHDGLQALARRLRLGTSASELHGSLTGYLAGGGAVDGNAVLGVLELDGEAIDPTAQDLALLDRLARQSQASLADAELGFEPLLPADDRPLHERAEAVVEWCRGFLGGFGLAGAAVQASLSGEAQEVLRDLGTIAGSSFDFGNESEDEDALIEVHEFVRMAAMLLFAECGAREGTGGNTVH
ncbi:UPF0149 family protein [Rhodanobacter lindaniclasticus]